MHVFQGGSFSPSNLPGTVLLNGDLIADTGAGFAFNLSGVNDSGLILMPNNTLALGGQDFDNFSFATEPDFGPGTYTLIEAQAISGSLGASANGTIDGLAANIAIQGGDVVLNVVPEPSTLVLLGAGFLGLMVRAGGGQDNRTTRSGLKLGRKQPNDKRKTNTPVHHCEMAAMRFRLTFLRRVIMCEKRMVRGLMTVVLLATMLAASPATAAVLTKSPNLSPYWADLGYGATKVYADSFVAPNSGTVNLLGTWLLDLTTSCSLTFQVYGSIGGVAANGPDLSNVYATTAVETGLAHHNTHLLSVLASCRRHSIDWRKHLLVRRRAIRASSGGYYEMGEHTQNSGGITDNGTFWYSNTPPTFDGTNKLPEIAFSVGVAIPGPTWSGGGADANWTTAANWGGTAPTASNSVTFSGTNRLTNNNILAANTQIDGITFDSTAGNFTLNGNAINLAGNVVNSGTNTQTNQLNWSCNRA